MSNENIPIGWLQDPDTEEKYYPYTHMDAIQGMTGYLNSIKNLSAPSSSQSNITAVWNGTTWAYTNINNHSLNVDGVISSDNNTINRTFSCTAQPAQSCYVLTSPYDGTFRPIDIGAHIRVNFTSANTITYGSFVFENDPDPSARYPIYVENCPLSLNQDYDLVGIVDFVFAFIDGQIVAQIIGRQKTFTGATAQANGIAGIVPQPLKFDKDNLLCGDGTWKSVNTLISEITTVLENDQTLAAAFAVAIKDYIV